MTDPTRNVSTPTQQTRDNMSMTDHDSITRITVLVETVLIRLTTIEQQIKDAILAQAAALASLDAKTTTNHNLIDSRVRVMETALAKYVPDYVNKVDTLQADVEILKTNKAETLVGWKVVVWIFGSMAGFASFIWLIAQALITLRLIK